MARHYLLCVLALAVDLYTKCQYPFRSARSRDSRDVPENLLELVYLSLQCLYACLLCLGKLVSLYCSDVGHELTLADVLACMSRKLRVPAL